MNVLVRDLDLPTWRHFTQGKLHFMVNPPFFIFLWTHKLFICCLNVCFTIEKLLGATNSSACYLKESVWHTVKFVTYSLSDGKRRQRYSTCARVYINWLRFPEVSDCKINWKSLIWHEPMWGDFANVVAQLDFFSFFRNDISRKDGLGSPSQVGSWSRFPNLSASDMDVEERGWEGPGVESQHDFVTDWLKCDSSTKVLQASNSRSDVHLFLKHFPISTIVRELSFSLTFESFGFAFIFLQSEYCVGVCTYKCTTWDESKCSA